MGISKYAQEDQLRIGEEIYDHVYTIYSAAARYGISPYTARDYLRRYKGKLIVDSQDYLGNERLLTAYRRMTKEDLIKEIMSLKKEIRELRMH